ncbi:MAG: cytidine deaminase [bacterium]|nr:cytidine deaminase [bacterium]
MARPSDEMLLQQAWVAREQACCPYSGFAVGAALECADGAVYTGCNVESSSYGLTCCAERIALFTALAAGARSFRRIAIVAEAPRVCPPCGACRQVLADYAPGLLVLMANRTDHLTLGLDELYPHSFDQHFLAQP